jgi:hypothetical protein
MEADGDTARVTLRFRRRLSSIAFVENAVGFVVDILLRGMYIFR